MPTEAVSRKSKLPLASKPSLFLLGRMRLRSVVMIKPMMLLSPFAKSLTLAQFLGNVPPGSPLWLASIRTRTTSRIGPPPIW
jgi:hypothetical protein